MKRAKAKYRKNYPKKPAMVNELERAIRVPETTDVINGSAVWRLCVEFGDVVLLCTGRFE